MVEIHNCIEDSNIIEIEISWRKRKVVQKPTTARCHLKESRWTIIVYYPVFALSLCILASSRPQWQSSLVTWIPFLWTFLVSVEYEKIIKMENSNVVIIINFKRWSIIKYKKSKSNFNISWNVVVHYK